MCQVTIYQPGGPRQHLLVIIFIIIIIIITTGNTMEMLGDSDNYNKSVWLTHPGGFKHITGLSVGRRRRRRRRRGLSLCRHRNATWLTWSKG